MTSYRQRIIAINSGHGLKTAGKRTPSGISEALFNHPCKEYLEIELTRNNFKVIDINPDINVDLSLDRICDIANDSNADLFVSTHFNAMGSKWQNLAQGIETYYHDNNLEMKKLGEICMKYLLQGTPQKSRGVKSDKTLYKNGLAVLRNTKMDALLFELGFMDYEKESQLMVNKAFQKECAIEICKGICEYFEMTYKPEIIIKPVEKEKEQLKTWKEILKEISPKYYQVWFNFVQKHTDVNLIGLITNLYYRKKG